MIGLFCEKVTTVPSVTVTRESRENRLQAEKALESWKKSVRNRDQQVTRKLEDTEITRAVERAETLQRSEQRAASEKELAEAFRRAEAEVKATVDR